MRAFGASTNMQQGVTVVLKHQESLPIGIDEGCPWTKIGQIHRNHSPTLPGPATAAGREAIPKSSIDSLWNLSFEERLRATGLGHKEQAGFPARQRHARSSRGPQSRATRKGYVGRQISCSGAQGPTST
jgi:hypothetical protein